MSIAKPLSPMRNLNVTRAASYAAALTAIALAPFTAQAQTAAASPDDVAALREQIRLLDQKLKVLERNLELKDETAVADAKKQPKITISDGKFEVASADGANSLRLRGLVQADGRYFADDVNAAGANDSFFLRRARIGFEGKFAERFQYVFQSEFGTGSSVSVLDANILAAINPAFNVRVGRFKTPIGLEQLQSDPVAFFNERSVVTGLTPNRDVGAQLEGAFAKNTISYQLGVFNGQPDGGNSAQGSGADFDNEKSGAARVFATPFANDKDSVLKGLGFGFAAGLGKYDTTSGRATQYRTDAQQTYFAYESSVLADGDGVTLSPQAYYYVGPFGLLAEFVSSTIDVRRTATQPVREVENTGWNLSAGYVLTGEESSYKGVTPKTTFNPSAGTWGAFEIVARVAEVDIDDSVFTGTTATRLANRNTSASGVTTYGLGLNWYLSKAVRVNVDYFQDVFELASGANPAANAVISDDEQTIQARVQVSF